MCSPLFQCSEVNSLRGHVIKQTFQLPPWSCWWELLSSFSVYYSSYYISIFGLSCMSVCVFTVSAFRAIVTVTLRSCVLNPNVRVGSRSRYPNDTPLSSLPKHTRGMTRQKGKNPTAVYTQPPLYTSYGHLLCQSRPSPVTVLFMTSFVGWVEPQIDARSFLLLLSVSLAVSSYQLRSVSIPTGRNARKSTAL